MADAIRLCKCGAFMRYEGIPADKAKLITDIWDEAHTRPDHAPIKWAALGGEKEESDG